MNTTTGERISGTCNSSGEIILDLSNLTSGYTNGDRIQITAIYGSGSGTRSLSKRHTVVTADGSYSIGSMVLHSGMEMFGTCNITFASITNSTAGGLYVDFYDRTNNVLVFRLECLTADTVSSAFGYLGVKMDGGFIRVFESETSGSLEALTIVK